MVNLIPQALRTMIRREYRLRLAVVASLAACFVFAAAAALLIPSYFLAATLQKAVLREQALLDQSLARKNLSDAAEQIRSAQALSVALDQHLALPRPSEALAQITAARPAGITVTRLEYATGGRGATVRISGVSDTREHLLAYKQNLAALPQVSSVDLPLENLAKSSGAPYAMVVELKRVNP